MVRVPAKTRANDLLERGALGSDVDRLFRLAPATVENGIGGADSGGPRRARRGHRVLEGFDRFGGAFLRGGLHIGDGFARFDSGGLLGPSPGFPVCPLTSSSVCGNRASSEIHLRKRGARGLRRRFSHFLPVLFVAASMAPFYGFRRVQNAFMTIAPQFLACAREGFPAQPAQATIACWAGYYPWRHAAIDLGAPVGITVICLVLANRLRHFGRQHFIQRLAELPLSPVGSTLFLRAFRDDQMSIRRASRNLFSSVFDLGRLPTTLDELMLERLDGRGDLIAIGNPQDRKGAARRSPWGAQRLYVDDAHWQETVTMLARDADRIVLCVDASDGVRWEIAHVLREGHANKTLFFLNPSIDVRTRTRLLMEDFSVSAADLASVNVDSILALRLTSPEQPILMFCVKPERDAYLVVARLAFVDNRQADSAQVSVAA